MPEFELKKLVRSKLIDEYEKSGQKVVVRELSMSSRKKELIRKIIEEVQEIDLASSRNDIAAEFADVNQAVGDLMVLCGVDQDKVELIRQEKLDKKGDFLSGDYIETIELDEDDRWVDYYRQSPDIFHEI